MYTPGRGASQVNAPLLAATPPAAGGALGDVSANGESFTSPTRFRRTATLRASDWDGDDGVGGGAPGMPFMEAPEGGKGFVIAQGGAAFMHDVLGIAPVNLDDEPEEATMAATGSAAQTARRAAQIVGSRVSYYCCLPCNTCTLFAKLLCTPKKGNRAKTIFAAACLASCLLSILHGMMQASRHPSTVCSARYGAYATCCNCVDLDEAYELMNITETRRMDGYDDGTANVSSMIDVPETTRANAAMFGHVGITTGLITLGMLYNALRSENVFLFFFAVFALFLQAVFDITVASRELEQHSGGAGRIVRFVTVAAGFAGVIIAGVAMPFVAKSFGLVGLKRGGLGPGAALFRQYMLQRAFSYVDQLAGYTFYTVSCMAMVRMQDDSPNRVSESEFRQVFLFFMCCVIVSEAASHAVLSAVIRREFLGGTLLAVAAQVANLACWSYVYYVYSDCYVSGLGTQNNLRHAIGDASTVAAAWEAQIRNTTMPIPYLFPDLDSVAATLQSSRECIADGTVFEARTTWMLFASFVSLVVAKFAQWVITIGFAVRHYGTQNIARLFFQIPERVTEADDVRVVAAEG